MENIQDQIQVTEKEAQKVFEMVKSVFAEELNIKEKDLTLNTHLVNDLHTDSLDRAIIIIQIDKKLNTYVNDLDGWGADNTLRDCCSGIARTFKEAGRL